MWLFLNYFKGEENFLNFFYEINITLIPKQTKRNMGSIIVHKYRSENSQQGIAKSNSAAHYKDLLNSSMRFKPGSTPNQQRWYATSKN